MPSPPHATRRAAGFTLIELLVIMALLSVVMFLGMPALFNMIYRSEILGVAQQTAMMMRVARLEAIKMQTQTLVKIDTAAGTVTSFVDTDGDKVFDSDEKQLGGLILPKGVTFMAVHGLTTPPTPAVAIFRSNGLAQTPGGFRFQNARGDQLEAEVLDKSGKVRLAKEQGGSWIDQGAEGNPWIWK